MNLIKPKQLQIGDKIRFIAPSGSVDQSKIEKSVEYFTKKGYKIELGKHLFAKNDYLAGNDDDRLCDLHEAFEDKSTKAIICARGGYGALRLLDKIDYDIIKNNPKIFCGYSDITLLNAMFLRHANLITFSGPMAQSDFSDAVNDYTEKEFFNTLSRNLTEILPTNLKVYNKGDTEGILFGGNLSTLASLCGRNFVPEAKFILLIEDLNEPNYKIDRYITQLLGINSFRANLAAILLGDFLAIEDRAVFEKYFMELGKEIDVPIYGGYPLSHSALKSTIPIGAYSTVTNGSLKISDYLAL